MAHDVCHSVCECISSQSTGPRRRFLCVLAIKGEREEVREGGEQERERGRNSSNWRRMWVGGGVGESETEKRRERS